MRVLVLDIGGTHVKAIATGVKARRKFDSGPRMGPSQMVKQAKALAADWRYEAVSMGYPGRVAGGAIVAEPKNLGPGWVGFDFARAFGVPVRIVNDAAMQALGRDERGRVLFVGLGTGLGTALVLDGQLIPLELAHLPYRKGRTYEDYAGRRGLERRGKRKWRKHVRRILALFRRALEPQTIVLGGGNAEKLGEMAGDVRLGSNADALEGGFRLWSPTP